MRVEIRLYNDDQCPSWRNHWMELLSGMAHGLFMDGSGIGFAAWFKIAKRLLYKLSIANIGDRGSGFGVRDSEFGVRNSGFGVRDSGFGIRNSGFGIRGSGNSQLPTSHYPTVCTREREDERT